MSTDVALPSTARQIVLARRPHGEPLVDDFALREVALAPPADGQVLVATTWMSVEPYMRGRMDDRPSYIPPFALDEPLEGTAVGVVLASRSATVPVGAAVSHFQGWRDHVVLDAAEVEVLDPDLPAEVHLGPLGAPGLTAYAALTRIAPVRPGDVVYVSAASGAVGSVAGRIARHLGATAVVGSAGGPVKVRHLTQELGYDAGLDRHGDLATQLAAAAPDGIDVYLDSVGGDHLEAALGAMRPGGRVALVGAIAEYNATAPAPGPANLYLAVKREITLRGMLVTHHLDLMAEHRALARRWVDDGSVPVAGATVDGLDQAPQALIDLLRGRHTGKVNVRVATEVAA